MVSLSKTHLAFLGPQNASVMSMNGQKTYIFFGF